MKPAIVARVAAASLALSSIVLAQDAKFSPQDQQIPPPNCLVMKAAYEGASAPCTEQDHEDWLADIRHWREERRIRTGYDGSRYNLPEFKWTQSSFMQPQLMVEDRYVYDPVAHHYTVD